MSYGPQSVFTLTLASAATRTTSYADLGRAWKRMYLEVPTCASGNFHIQAAATADGTYRRIAVDNGNTATAQLDFVVKSTVSQRIVPVPAGGVRFVKVENDTGVDNVQLTFNIICGD